MSSNYAPVPGNIVVHDGFVAPVKLPIATDQRSYPSGTPMWLNKISAGGWIVEPSLLSTVNAGSQASVGSSSASTYTTLELANAAFAPLFAGFAGEARVPQQLLATGDFSSPGNATSYANDASTPFITVYPSGYATAPIIQGGALGVTTQIEVGTFVDLAGFANETVTGFYDPSGTLQSSNADYYTYMNAVQATTTVANAIGVVIEQAPVGQTYVKFKFDAHALSAGSLG